MDIRSTLFCSLLAAGVVAHAEGIYVLGSVGKSVTDIKDASRTDIDAVYIDNGYDIVSSKLDKNDSAYKLQLGYQFGRNFALEGGYVHLGKAVYKATLFDGVSDSDVKLSYETKGWNLDGVLTLPVNAGVSVFGKLGLIYADTKLAGPGGSESVKKTKPTVGVGIAWNFWQNLSARAECERFINLGDKDKIGSTLNIDLYSVGLSYQF